MRFRRTCERRDASVSRETASAGPSPAQLTELRLLYTLSRSRGFPRRRTGSRNRMFLSGFRGNRRTAGVSYALPDATASPSHAVSACARSFVGVKRAASARERATADVARASFSCNYSAVDVAPASSQVSRASVRVDPPSVCVAGASARVNRPDFRAAAASVCASRASVHVAGPSIRVKRSSATATFAAASIDHDALTRKRWPGAGRVTSEAQDACGVRALTTS